MPQEEGWNCFVDRSTDGGLTFERTPDLDVPDGAGIIQPTLWQSAPGKVHMLMRSDSHHVYRADSVRPVVPPKWRSIQPAYVSNERCEHVTMPRALDGAHDPVSLPTVCTLITSRLRVLMA